MIKKINYPADFGSVIKYLRAQVLDSVDQLEEDYPKGSFQSAPEIWQAFKPKLKYVNDPPEAELFQCYHTLFYKNFHGIPGAGDCDCFSILAAAAAISSGLPYNIVLASRYRDAPIHIYTTIENKVVDFTRRDFNTERFYPFVQKFSF